MQALSSSHFKAEPGLQLPFAHLSARVQMELSLHGAVLLLLTQP